MTASLPLDGRVAVVTGASSGMGAASAERLAALGARVVVIARRADRLDGLVARVQTAGGTALALATDTTDTAAIEAAAARVQSELGGADLLFNNAGVMRSTPATGLDGSQWQHQIAVNVNGLVNTLAAFTPQLVASAAEHGVADIINTSSVTANQVEGAYPVYASTKAFISHLSRNLRAELGAKKIRVTVIEPGLVDTEMVESQATNEGAHAFLEAARAQFDWLAPDDIATVVGHVATLPAHMNLHRITVMPTGQA
ncbi:MAG: SDR family oxidoreductase [Actinomyces sp.]|jgi:NADP-dependent 3-hydroxy acid dehydrogenase YdfG|nr:SDR family oxidoreductase [Actinomyces sp.]MCI1642258.1 SDR family oxidoreductase [Actinomyces sp.]MCI1662557.1 SDR family oxidoreductase [Actinomyces sp.]MCI1690934.1 SDR family oxidoreductase [Actinomyces sp.]MCI1788277.1 SDR family oxidoreductase [Actinomyces sp.]MCI1831082.1 SDR family oxidoreductase [Actinomyces sp.]